MYDWKSLEKTEFYSNPCFIFDRGISWKFGISMEKKSMEWNFHGNECHGMEWTWKSFFSCGIPWNFHGISMPSPGHDQATERRTTN